MAEQKSYGRDVKTISRHINNALKEELAGATVAKFATVQIEGDREVVRQIEHYDLDMIISAGYRVKSQRGVEFRRWANSVLKEYILKGYAVNDKRMSQLGQIVRVMKRVENRLDTQQVLSVIESYSAALDLLDDYDHQTLNRPKGNEATYTLTYEECREVIDRMKFGTYSDIFGNEKDDSFKGSIGAIYQSFGGKDLYPSLEEKASNLLYFVTKNHSFSDGNKRIAATMFLCFLDKNGALFINGDKRMADYTLAALTIMIADSKPQEKEKTTIYPIVKKVAQALGLRMTKQIFAEGVSKVVPVVGGAVAGGLTYATFKPSCLRLKHSFWNLNLCDVEFYEKIKRGEISEMPEDEVIDINEDDIGTELNDKTFDEE